MGRPAIFLDRDDTLIYDIPYLSEPDKVRLTPGAAEALRRLSEAGYALVMASNQSGIGRGYFTVQQLEAVNGRVCELLAAGGASLDGIYYCPHLPSDDCQCRKPRTGLLEAAVRDLDLETAGSYMIGDSAGDIQAGRNFGLRTIQVRLPGRNKPDQWADYAVENLLEAAELILGGR